MEVMPSWITLLPPVITLIIAGLSKNVSLSLLVGIFTGGFIATNFEISSGIVFGIKKIGATFIEPTTLTLFAFLALLSLVIELMGKSGGVAAYVSLLQKKIKNARNAEIAVILFSFLFCIDDYINNMLTGAIIRPFSERFLIAREKIAFLLNSLSSPLVAIIPASTWAAMIITRIEDAGVSDIPSNNQIIDADPFFTYVKSIPFSFYSICIIASVFFIVYRRISYGAMAHLEEQAKRQTPPIEETITRKTSEESIASFLIPLTCFLLFLPIFLLYLGNSQLFGGQNGLLEALQHTNVMASLCFTSIISSVILGVFLLYKKKTTIKGLFQVSFASIWGMRN
ncbi:MAG: Sodium:proton antiporter, partial [candidate division TM6 bacterium GW2011_GWF2_43_17]